MMLRGFSLGRPQRVAALLLVILFGECLVTIANRPLDSTDYRYARCGREMWEQPSAIAGYFTTCGNLNGDGFFAYRLAGFPLTMQRMVLLASDHFRAPQDRVYTNGSLNGSTWEARHELSFVRWLLRLPFTFFALWLGAGLWWVARRLFGNEGGAFALALYVFCPEVVRYATRPNNEVLALWGLYGLVYTAIGVAHALQGPRSKWRPRILLLTAALGLTAAAHLLAAMVGFCAAVIFLFYVAQGRRSAVPQIITVSALGAFVVLFSFFGFRLQPFSYVFTGGSARFWFSTDAVRLFFSSPSNLGITVACAASAFLYLAHRRSRYFGNTAPLLMFLALAFLYTTQVFTEPLLWALPFLFTFLGGVFADVLESRQRKMFVLLAAGIVVTQAALCMMTLAGMLR